MRRGLLLGIGLMAAFGAYAQESPVVAEVRTYASGYVRGLPNYTCSQETRRSSSGPNLRNLRADTIEEELSFVGGMEHYKVLKVNGVAANNVAHDQLGGAISSGEFGSVLWQIFSPRTLTVFRAPGSGKLHGRAMVLLPFRVPQQTGYGLDDDELGRQFRVPFEGTVWVDAETKAVMKIEMKLVDFPKETRMTASEVTLEYKPVMLSGQEFILPSQFRWDWRKREWGRQPAETGTNQIEFKACRKYSIESSISFDK